MESTNVVKYLPHHIRQSTKYSVDASLYFHVENPTLAERVTLEDFNPNNPNICFRHAELQRLDTAYYLDLTWALDADSPQAAADFVAQNLANVIPVPNGLQLNCIELGLGADTVVYDHETQAWCY